MSVKILVTGSRGMLGSHVIKALNEDGIPALSPPRSELDLEDSQAVNIFLQQQKPTHVIHCAATVAGILENVKSPVRFIRNNLRVDTNVIDASLHTGVENFLYVSSSCVYPCDYIQPLKESYILAGELEPTNKSYAMAKLAGMEFVAAISKEFSLNYKTIIPSNLYGPGDNFDLVSSHLVAATLRKTYEAVRDDLDEVLIYGSGESRREFTYVEDLAFWISRVVGNINKLPQVINLGYGTDYSILEYYEMAAAVTNFEGKFKFDLSMPIGMHQKLLDSEVARNSFGWSPKTSPQQGMERTLEWWMKNSSITR
jgi:GDP-L-fucose synthase